MCIRVTYTCEYMLVLIRDSYVYVTRIHVCTRVPYSVYMHHIYMSMRTTYVAYIQVVCTRVTCSVHTSHTYMYVRTVFVCTPVTNILIDIVRTSVYTSHISIGVTHTCMCEQCLRVHQSQT